MIVTTAVQLAELWPNGSMDNNGIKSAVNKAKERRSLHLRYKVFSFVLLILLHQSCWMFFHGDDWSGPSPREALCSSPILVRVLPFFWLVTSEILSKERWRIAQTKITDWDKSTTLTQENNNSVLAQNMSIYFSLISTIKSDRAILWLGIPWKIFLLGFNFLHWWPGNG